MNEYDATGQDQVFLSYNFQFICFRELAQQTRKVVIALGDYMGAQCHACIGGTSVKEDMRKLEAGQHIVVGECKFSILLYFSFSSYPTSYLTKEHHGISHSLLAQAREWAEFDARTNVSVLTSLAIVSS